MKRILYILLIAVSSVLWTSCEYSIDDVPLYFLGVDDIVSDSMFTIGFVEDMYGSLPKGYSRLEGTSMISSTTDEAVESGRYTEAEKMALGAWSASDTHDDAWGTMYAAIRKTNVFLDEIYPAIPEGLFNSQRTVELLKGQAYFFRALFHFELVKRYGGVPIVTTVLKAGDGTNTPRDTYDDCVSFIVAECDRAANILPVEWSNASVDFGRITKGAALALKARALLYAASPLFNDATKSENTLEHGAYDVDKWKQAAQAAHEVMALNYYQLYYSYQGFFTNISNNKEIILLRMEGQNNTVERLNGPSGFTDGGGGACPTLDLVNSYAMADGSDFDWNDPIQAAHPFENREVRFYASVLSNGDSWMGEVIDTYEGGDDMGSINSSKTGFYLKKFMSENARWFGGYTGGTYHCFSSFRYAEVLLNYAEAMNEAFGPSDPETFTKTAVAALNEVRLRAGLSGIDANIEKEALRDIIRRERKVELAFEEHRHLDLRRWKVASEVLNTPVKGLKIIKNEDGTFSYQPQVAQSRVFKPEMYLYPIPQNEINRNSKLVQNTGW